MKATYLIVLVLLFALTSCMPNTYYSTTDDYVIGLRWHDRGKYDIAAKYWDPLVEKGDCDAEYQTGLLYFLGQAKPQDNSKALALWRKAAEGNQQRAQWALGDLYYQNKEVIMHKCADCGIQKDLVTALFWYRLFEKSAKYSGEKKYLAYILPKITSEMTPEQIAQSNALAAQWKPTPKDCGARNLW
jgi:hypothetical protein